MRETSRTTSKSRPTRTKSRRSPYPHISHTEYNTTPPTAAEYTEKPTQPPYDYSTDLSLALQSSYTGLMYPQESMERYGALYSSAYGHPGLYGGDRSMYSYGTHSGYFDERSYRSSAGYDDSKYLSCRDANSLYPGYVTTGTQSHDLRTASNESRDSYRQSDSSTGSHCEYSQSLPTTTPCSRSQSYGYSYTSREDDITDDYEKRRRTSYETLLEASRLSEDTKTSFNKSSCREVSSTSSTSSSTNSTSRPSNVSSIQQSVIMRRQSNTTDTNNGELTDISSNTTSDIKSAASLDSAGLLDTTKLKSLDVNPLYSSQYDSYGTNKNSSFTNGLQTGRSYPVVPQAGYTSVIVDAQQYHMSNGYVH